MKVDLFLVLSEYRNIDDLLSNEFLEIVRNFFKESTSVSDMTKIKSFNKLIQIQKYNDSTTLLHKLINSLNDIKSNEVHFKKINTIELESIMLELTSDLQHKLLDPYLYNYELLIGIYLATLYRKRNNFNKSLEILLKCKSNLTLLNSLTLQQSNYLGSVVLNICYCYHRKGLHKEVIDEGMNLLMNDKYQISRYLVTDIQIRIGIAYHFIGKEEEAECILKSTLFFESGERKEYRIKMLKRMYNIVVN